MNRFTSSGAAYKKSTTKAPIGKAILKPTAETIVVTTKR